MKIYNNGMHPTYWLEIGEAEDIRIPFDSFYTDDRDPRNTTLINNNRITVSLWNGASDEFLLLAQEEGIEATENN